MRRFLLAGGTPALEAALDRFLVRTTVLGVKEREGEIEVCNVEGLEVVLPLPGVEVPELPVGEEPATGLERDAPVLVSDRILVRPPWVARPVGFSGIEPVVPRGMAFGSGEHGSTRAALLAMDALWKGTEAPLADIGRARGSSRSTA